MFTLICAYIPVIFSLELLFDLQLVFFQQFGEKECWCIWKATLMEKGWFAHTEGTIGIPDHLFGRALLP